MMTLTKADLVESVANIGFTKGKSEQILEEILESIKGTLARHENVLISGFGKFSVRDKRKRRGRNPATGSQLMLNARRVVTFKCSSVLKDKINQSV